MAMTMHCDIVSAEKSIFSGLVEMVVAAGSLGDLGIAPGHAPLLTALIPGPVKLILQNGEEEVYYRVWWVSGSATGKYCDSSRHSRARWRY